MNNRFKLSAFADEADSKLEGQIEALKENNIQFLEIRGVDGRNISEISTEEAKSIRRKLDDNNIKVWSIGSPTGKIDVKDDFSPHFDKFKHMIELANILDAEHYRLFSFYGTSAGSECRDEVMLRLSRFLEASKGSGIVLCHENEKDIYGEKSAECADIHETFPEMKAVFDPANFIQCGQDVMNAWRKLGKYIEYLHIKDAKADGGVVPAGCGIGQISEIIKLYGEIGGTVLSLEPHLTVFKGFENLEKSGNEIHEKEYIYNSPREAFDTAAKALIKLL